MDDFKFEDLRVQINPQSGADRILVADRVANRIDFAAFVDLEDTILRVAGRPQVPPAIVVGEIDRSTSNRMFGRLALSCAIGAEILINFGNA